MIDFATGSGLVGIAAKIAGARCVIALDIDPFCANAVAMNARLNARDIEFSAHNSVGKPIEADIILAGDVFYDRAMANEIIPWFSFLARSGTIVLIGDPGRSYLPRHHLKRLSTHQVKVTRALEDADVRETTVWQFIA